MYSPLFLLLSSAGVYLPLDSLLIYIRDVFVIVKLSGPDRVVINVSMYLSLLGILSTTISCSEFIKPRFPRPCP